MLIEKPIAEDDAEDALEIGALAKQKGLVATVNHSLLYDPQVKRALEPCAPARSARSSRVDILRGSEYPPYEGGPLPPWYRDAGYPFRDLGVHCLYLIQELLGPIEDVEADWRSLGGDPNLAFDEWRAMVRCKRGLGQFQLTWNTKPMQSQLIIHGTKGVLRVDLFAMFHGKRASTPLPKAAERLVNAFADSIQPLIDVPIGVWKFVRKEVQAYQGLRDLVADFYRRLAAGEPPPVSVEDAAQVVAWVEKVARAADAEHAARARAVHAVADRVPFLVTGASGSLGTAVVSGCAPTASACACSCAGSRSSPIDGVEYCFGNLGDPAAVDRAVAGAERRDPLRRGDEGRLARAQGRHRRRHAERDRRVQEARREAARAHLVDVGDRLGGLGGQRPGQRGGAARAAPRRARRVHAREARGRAAGRRGRAAAGLPCVILRPGPDLRRRHPADQRRGRAQRRRPLARARRRQARAAARLHRRRRRRDHARAIDRKLAPARSSSIIDPEHLTQERRARPRRRRDGRSLRVPRPVVFALGKLSEYPLGALGRQSPVAVYRLQSALARCNSSATQADRLLGWRPRVGVREGIRRVLDEESS